MKKAKIALVAIAIIGVVGGSLAFKAKSRFITSKLYYTSVFSAVPPSTNTAVATLAFAPGLTTVTVTSPTTIYYTTTFTAPATTNVIYTGQ